MTFEAVRDNHRGDVILIALALGFALQPGAPESPTVIENAVAQHRCTTAPPAAYETCLSSQFAALRTDFGRDLSRISAADRKAIDSVCSKFDASVAREAYVKCLSDQLVKLRDRHSRANPQPAAPAPPPPPASDEPASPTPPPIPASSSAMWWIGGGLVALLAVGGGLLLARKSRRPAHKCRNCGQDVTDPGDLCQKCRHEAAEALRSAAVQRAEQARAERDEQSRQHEQEEEQRRKKAKQEEDARARKEEQARQEAQSRREEETRRQEQDAARRLRESGVQAQDFDPYGMLGVSREASSEQIHDAYEAAKKKYDPELVADMGGELQEHFKAKAADVERAFQILTAPPN